MPRALNTDVRLSSVVVPDNTQMLASALERLGALNARIPMPAASQATSHMFIVAPLSARALGNLFSTHPPIEERVRRLRGGYSGSFKP